MVSTWSGFGEHIKRASKFDGNNTFAANGEIKNLRQNKGEVGLQFGLFSHSLKLIFKLLVNSYQLNSYYHLPIDENHNEFRQT
jgi:hypothetical protein